MDKPRPDQTRKRRIKRVAFSIVSLGAIAAITVGLSRQLAEAHGGTLTLENRVDGTGCEAGLQLPVAKAMTIASN